MLPTITEITVMSRSLADLRQLGIGQQETLSSKSAVISYRAAVSFNAQIIDRGAKPMQQNGRGETY